MGMGRVAGDPAMPLTLRPARLRHATELMDDAADSPTLERTLQDLAAINRWLGGVRSICAAVRPWLVAHAHVAILDIGCGAGDIAQAITELAGRTGTRVTITAIDRNPTTAAIARSRTRATPDIRVACADAYALPFADRAFDIAFMSLTLHHFDDADGVSVVREMARVAAGVVIVHELERSWPHYLGARFLAATLWRGSPHTRHDGPVSVLRAFTRRELERALAVECLAPAAVRRRFFYRLIAVARRGDEAAAATTV